LPPPCQKHCSSEKNAVTIRAPFVALNLRAGCRT
jgi:hypothetical protein